MGDRMKITVLTLFPEVPESYFAHSLVKRAVDRNIIEYSIVDIRDYANDKHRTCDDYAYGGGPGMVLKPEPIAKAIKASERPETRVVFPSPVGESFSQEYADILARESDLLFLCGRYEGVDQRIIDNFVTDCVSVGDYVLSSGEVGALVVIDAICRLVPGFIREESVREESFRNGLLEYPQYTRPEEYQGMSVPKVLVEGNHARIDSWRKMKSIENTLKYRPDLFDRRYREKKRARAVRQLGKRGEI